MDTGFTLARRAWPARLYLWACDRLYRELAGTYDAVSWLVSLGAWDAWRRLALAEINGQVLELGYGTGALLAAMTAGGRSAVGVELSPQMQRVAAQRCAGSDGAALQIRGRAEQLPLAASSFDTIVATFPAPYILAPPTLAECRRVLRAGGRLVVAGLWVQAPRRSPLRFVPVFYGAPSPQQVDRLLGHLARAGFHARLEWRRAAHGTVAMLIADVLPAEHPAAAP